MNKTEFKKAAKTEKSYNIYSIKSISEKDNKGFKISYSKQLSKGIVTPEIEKEFWNMSLDEIATQFIYN